MAEGWDGLPVTLDASFTWTNGRVYFFKGSQYWRFTTPGQLDPGYPKSLSDGFEGIPNNVDAALVWAANSKIYFFKGQRFYLGRKTMITMIIIIIICNNMCIR